jgi:hypothetical protein
MATQRDQMIQLAAERSCADQIGRRMGATELELARFGRHVAECSAQVAELTRTFFKLTDEVSRMANEVRLMREDIGLFFPTKPDETEPDNSNR